MNRISLLAVATVAASLTLVAVTDGSVKQQPVIRTDAISITKNVSQEHQKYVQHLHKLSREIADTETVTWNCQDRLLLARTKPSVSAWALPRSVKYRQWVLNRWQTKRLGCLTRQSQRTISPTGDWLTAVKEVQRIYPGTSSWLLFISDREGGYGRFVMNTQGSGAGGWMQFMSSTYYSYSNAAFATARSRGFIVPASENSWYSPLGQAITAGYMRFTGRDGCHWCL